MDEAMISELADLLKVWFSDAEVGREEPVPNLCKTHNYNSLYIWTRDSEGLICLKDAHIVCREVLLLTSPSKPVCLWIEPNYVRWITKMWMKLQTHIFFF